MKRKIFYCVDCNNEFNNVKWNGNETVCPRCDSRRYYDITEEIRTKREAFKRTSSSNDSPYP